MAYMICNPHYFEQLSGRQAKDDLIKEYYLNLRRGGLVAAAELPAYCIKCPRGAELCHQCIYFLTKKHREVCRGYEGEL